MNILLNISGNNLIEDIKNFIVFTRNAFVGFDWSDALDILLLTILFSIAVKFFKSRKAGALIVGIGVCAAIFVVASLLGLGSIRFILSGVFQIGALAIVIIFQPEIRDLLEKMGSGSIKGFKFFGEFSSHSKSQYRAVDSICKAVHVLSVEKTGALIVLERTTKLDDIIDTGTTINADVNDSLIRNLFYNRAPLHDGAIIIDDDKIVSAACILPLPRRAQIDSDLGTRHRAAIGLSEISDAIIIVVSEETGVISVAKECELIRDFTADSLRKYLYAEFVNESDVPTVE